MKIQIEQHGEKFTFETDNAISAPELIDNLYGLCVAAGYHPDSITGAMYEKGYEMSEDVDEDNGDVVSSGVYDPIYQL